ncbi:hypothetical protein [Streptomyces cyaneogriseus]|nr:hypothetical protein [Streptomyces cyaneogriseus]
MSSCRCQAASALGRRTAARRVITSYSIHYTKLYDVVGSPGQANYS